MANYESVRIASVVYHAGFAIDAFLCEIASRLRTDGVRLGGAVQENLRAAADATCAAMVLTELKTQRRIRISQDLGPLSEGCRLDAAGLAEAGGLLDHLIDADTELVIFNRFGIAEVEGHGLRAVFARAVEAGIPVLASVRPPYTVGWTEFHGGLAVDLPTKFEPVLAWARESVRLTRAARQAALSPAAGPA